jgi:hypothetical protein
MRALLVFLVLATAPSVAHADAFLRVIAQKASVRTGPSNGYREIAIVQRNQVFQVLERGTRDFWFKIELDDGTSGWILGDLVFPFEVGEEGQPGAFTRMGRAIKRAILGPSPVPYSHVGLSFSVGMLDREGVYLLRPSWLVDPYWAVEAHVGLSPRSDNSAYLSGLTFVLRMAPGAVICPFATLGLGVAHIVPKADNPVEMATVPEQSLMTLGAGGGFEITFKKQITLRLDARNWTIFDENKSSNAQEYTGGLAIFF